VLRNEPSKKYTAELADSWSQFDLDIEKIGGLIQLVKDTEDEDAPETF